MKSVKSLLLLTSSLFIGILLNSCDGRTKLTPEDEVRNYSKYFVDKLAANQLDSLAVSYPDIAKADSIMPITSDTIIVAENAPGQFDIILGEGISLKVNRAEDGNISVTESKGLFAFPADKVDIAKKTGMWDDNLSDARLNERMKDDEFFSYLKNSKKVNPKNILKLITGEMKSLGGTICTGKDIIINNTDQTIDGSDYVMIEDYYNGDWMHPKEGKRQIPGKTLKPHESYKRESYGGALSDPYSQIVGVKMKLTPEQLQERFAPYTGNEYQEYLNSKK